MKEIKAQSITVIIGILICIGFVMGCKKEKEVVAPGITPVENIAENTAKDRVVARVGDREIKETELANTAQAYAQNLMQRGQMPPPNFKDSVLDMLIEDELLYQSGRKKDSADLDKKVEKMYAEIAGRFPSEEAMAQSLAQGGLTPAALRDELKKEAIVQAVLDEKVLGQATVSDGEIVEFYEDVKEELKQPERVRASHILLAVPKNCPEEEKKKIQEECKALKKRIDKGEAFEDLAKEYSACPSKKKGGDLGFFKKGTMVPAFEEAAWRLPVGQVSESVETDFGYHLIRVDDKRAAGIPPLEEVQEQIATSLKAKKVNERVKKLAEELKKEIKVEKLK